MILIPAIKIIACLFVGLIGSYMIGRMIGLGIGVSLRNIRQKQN